jgi:hypothetical protein
MPHEGAALRTWLDYRPLTPLISSEAFCRKALKVEWIGSQPCRRFTGTSEPPLIAASANSLPSQMTFFLMGRRCTQAINTTGFIGGAGGQP